MHTRRETLLCHYLYDPLDRLVDCIPAEQANTQRFYLKDRLATEIQGATDRSIMQHDDQLLAQQQRQDGGAKTTLLATDQQRSVLNELDAIPPRAFAYTPYGHRSPEGGLHSLLGFNGERPDPMTGCYLLGNGYRAFNPVLMRFNSPDSLSPFGKGGLNAYVYCVGDPVNRLDPTGHVGNPFKGLLNMLGRTPRRVRANQAFDAAIQTPVSVPTSQARNAPVGPPPPYSVEPPTRRFSGISQQERDALPPTYSESEAHRVLPPYSQGDNLASLQRHSISTPDLEAPPPYFEPVPQPALTGRIQHRINRLDAQRERIRNNTRYMTHEQLGTSIPETLERLTTEIEALRRHL